MAEGKNGAEDISVHMTGDTAVRFRAYRASQIGPKVTDSALGTHLISIALATMPLDAEHLRKGAAKKARART